MGEDRTGGDRTEARRRTTVAEAAEVLGISAEAVRGRIRRGTLPVEREGGTVYVLLDYPTHERTTTDQPRTTERPTDRTDALIATLREQLEAERQAHAEARRIIAGLVERIPPAIEAPERATDTAEGSDPTPPRGGAQEGAQRPWWRRILGG